MRKVKPISVSLPPKLVVKARKEAFRQSKKKERSVSVSEIVSKALKKYLSKESKSED